MTSTTPDRSVWRTAIAVALWLGVWQVASLLLHQDLLLVSPWRVAVRLVELVTEPGFWTTVAASFVRISSGFLLGMTTGVLLAAASASGRWVRTLLAPGILVIKSVPVVSFIILLLIWASSGMLAFIISFLMVLPVAYASVLEGIDARDGAMLQMARVFAIPFGRRLLAIDMPEVLPYFTAAARIGLGLCWKSGIAAEVIGLTQGSIGERLYQAKIFLSTADLFAWTITIVALSYTFEAAFLGVVRLAGSRLKVRP